MADAEESGSGRWPSGRERAAGHARYRDPLAINAEVRALIETLNARVHELRRVLDSDPEDVERQLAPLIMNVDLPREHGRPDAAWQQYVRLPGMPLLRNPVEVGANGRPTGVELELPPEEGGSPYGGAEDPEADTSSEMLLAPFRPESIKIDTQTTTVDLLLSRLREGMIDLAPDFQRRPGIWTDVQQSRLIESLLLRIPISSLYMAQDEDDTWSVVDGMQRLTAVARFMAPESVGMPPLVLRGLDYLRDFHGRRYEDLTGRLRIRLRESQLVVHIIEQGTPEAVKYNVFARINTGGLPLNPQELRHALVRGPVRELLADLAEDPVFGEATGWSVSNERMADREMVLRFLAFRVSDPMLHTQRDFDRFLIEAMHRINRIIRAGERERERLVGEFRSAMSTARKLFAEHAFRKWRGGSAKSPVNKALFEAVAVNIAGLSPRERDELVASRDTLLDGYFALMADWDFDRSISIGTGDPKRVRTRFGRMRELFRGVVDGA